MWILFALVMMFRAVSFSLTLQLILFAGAS